MVHPVQEGQAPRVGEEVADLRPVRIGQIHQRRGDLGSGERPVVELALGTEQPQRGVDPAPGRFPPLDLLEEDRGLASGGAGRLGVDSLPLLGGDLDIGVRSLLPRRLGPPPVPGHEPVGLHRGVEDVQAVLQARGCRGPVLRLGELPDRRSDPPGGIGDDDLQGDERLQLVAPGLGRTVGDVAAEEGRQSRRFDADQSLPHPKKTSSTAVSGPGPYRPHRGPSAPARLCRPPRRPFVRWSNGRGTANGGSKTANTISKILIGLC